MRLFKWELIDDEGDGRIVARGTTDPGNPRTLVVPLMALVKLHYPDGTGVQVIARGHGPTGTDGGGVAASFKLGPVPPDTANHYLVGAQGDGFVILKLAGVDGAGDMARNGITREHALNLAAWLVALADEGDGEWERLLEAVKAT